MQETKETGIGMLAREDPLEGGMATHSSILAWKIPGAREPGGLQSVGSQRVGHAECLSSTSSRSCTQLQPAILGI